MNESELKALISLLDDEDLAVFEHVNAKLLSLGEEIVPVLEEEWERNLSPLVQERIENILHQMQFATLQLKLSDWLDHNQDDLLEGMWLIATYQYPDLEIEKLREQIDNLFYEAWRKAQDLDIEEPREYVELLNELLFAKYRFASNTKNFHSPSNSMINIVLEQKKGNPISLSVIYLLLAQRLRVPIFGVNLPKLFVLSFKTDIDTFYINTNNKGVIFGKEDVTNFLDSLKLPLKPEYYEPCSHLDIIVRVLRNLEYAYVKLGEEDCVADIRTLLTIALSYKSK